MNRINEQNICVIKHTSLTPLILHSVKVFADFEKKSVQNV